MMTNIFSMFDPSMGIFFSLWLIIFMTFLLLPSVIWFSGLFLHFFYIFLGGVKGEMEYVLKNPMKGCYSFTGSVFLFISLLNFMALFPFLFSVTSHLLVTLPLAYTFWVGIIVFCLVSSVKHFLAHLIPTGTPVLLMSFMVIVELLSNFIRPIALTFRLTANMMAGHLLMSLIGGFLISLPFSFLLMGSLVQSMLVIMELGVSIIQSYVFSTLLLLYLSDSEH